MTSAPKGRVLIVDDEPHILRLLSVSLGGRGYDVEGVVTGAEAIEKARNGSYDTILLDLGLPDMDGLQTCQELRTITSAPIIIITVREDERDKVAALDLGADDYVTKPFGIDELLARMRANLRRSAVPAEVTVSAGPLLLDTGRRRVTVDGQEVHLTPTEYNLLRVLGNHCGRVVTHRHLLREARGPAYEEDTPLLRVHMVALRQKLGITRNRAGYIATEPGIGYRLLDEDRVERQP